MPTYTARATDDGVEIVDENGTRIDGYTNDPGEVPFTFTNDPEGPTIWAGSGRGWLDRVDGYTNEPDGLY